VVIATVSRPKLALGAALYAALAAAVSVSEGVVTAFGNSVMSTPWFP
jgi:hypothetical protein